MTIEKMIATIEAEKPRSAWNKGVKEYALEFLEALKEYVDYEGRSPANRAECKEWLLNGAKNWKEYSWGGSALIYNHQIAERLCTPSELKKTRNGERLPNKTEDWLDVQARALYQACQIVLNAFNA